MRRSSPSGEGSSPITDFQNFQTPTLNVGSLSVGANVFTDLGSYNSKTPPAVDWITFYSADYGQPDYVVSWQIVYSSPWDELPDAAFDNRFDKILSASSLDKFVFKLDLDKKIYDDQGNWSSSLNDRILSVQGSISAALVTSPQATSAVPEPSTYGLLGCSVIAGLIGVRRFRLRRAIPQLLR